MRQLYPLPISSVSWFALAATVIVLPFILSGVLLAATGSTWHDLTPYSPPSLDYLTDEVYYWHQAASFRATGFDAGYYTVNERPAASGTPYYAWGIFVPMFYAALAEMGGWPLYAMPLYNLGVLSLGLMVFVAVTRPTHRGLLVLSAALISFVPFTSFHFVSMLPVLEMGLSCLIAVALARCCWKSSTSHLIATLTLIVVASLIRATWALMLLPVLLVLVRRPHWWWATAIALTMNAALWGITFHTAAPYPDTLSFLFEIFNKAPFDALYLFSVHFLENLSSTGDGLAPEVFFRLTVLTTVGVLLFVRRKSQVLRTAETVLHANAVRSAAAVILTQFGLLVLLLFTVYDLGSWRDLRLLAPFVWLALLLMIAYRWHVEALVVCAVMALGTPSALNEAHHTLQSKSPPLLYEEIESWQQQLSEFISFEPDAPNRWCNTFTYNLYYLGAHSSLVLAVEPGIGLTFIMNIRQSQQIRFPLQARWLLLTDGFAAEHRDQLRVERLLTVPNGALYRNLDSPCDGLQPSPTDDS